MQPDTALRWANVGQNIYSSCLSALLRESFPEQPLQQVHTANEDNFERWLDGIPLNSEWEQGEKRQRGSHIERDKSDECVCQSRAVWISYSAVPLAPAIVGDTSALSSQGSVPTCIKGLSKALLTPPGLLPGSPKTKGFQSCPQTQWIPALLSLQYPAFQK